MTETLLRVLAIDPGPTESAWAWLNNAGVVLTGTLPNADLLRQLREQHWPSEVFAVEMIAGSYGQSVGIETVRTIELIGRIVEITEAAYGAEPVRIYRKTAVTHVANNARAADSHVRQALIDRWGGNSVALERPRKCSLCRGKGQCQALAMCRECTGSGQVQGVRSLKKCGACRGKGEITVAAWCSCADGMTGQHGPLVGVSGDEWAALAVAVTAFDQVNGKVAR